MDKTALRHLRQSIRNTILTALAGRGLYYLPALVSARHVHLSGADFEVLCGIILEALVGGAVRRASARGRV
jgi:propanediol utilization protein